MKSKKQNSWKSKFSSLLNFDPKKPLHQLISIALFAFIVFSWQEAAIKRTQKRGHQDAQALVEKDPAKVKFMGGVLSMVCVLPDTVETTDEIERLYLLKAKLDRKKGWDYFTSVVGAGGQIANDFDALKTPFRNLIEITRKLEPYDEDSRFLKSVTLQLAQHVESASLFDAIDLTELLKSKDISEDVEKILHKVLERHERAIGRVYDKYATLLTDAGYIRRKFFQASYPILLRDDLTYVERLVVLIDANKRAWDWYGENIAKEFHFTSGLMKMNSVNFMGVGAILPVNKMIPDPLFLEELNVYQSVFKIVGVLDTIEYLFTPSSRELSTGIGYSNYINSFANNDDFMVGLARDPSLNYAATKGCLNEGKNPLDALALFSGKLYKQVDEEFERVASHYR